MSQILANNNTFFNKKNTELPDQDEKDETELKQVKQFWDAVNLKDYETNSTLTKLFFEEYELQNYLNSDCRSIVQFGAATGNPLDQYKNRGWDVTAYDYSPKSYEILTHKGIKARFVDLNSVTQQSIPLSLTYNNLLIEDLSKVTNIFAVRILQFLKPESLPLILSKLADLPSPGSTYIFVGKVFPEEEGEEIVKDDRCRANYISSFFAQRKDMQILLQTTTNNKQAIKNAANTEIINEGDDEILVIKKVL